MAADQNAINAHDLQSKFELYFIGLIFTLLGFAIQTSKPQSSQIFACFELFSWILLMVAGIIGMNRLIWAPVVMHHFAAINRKQEALDQIASQIGMLVEIDGVEYSSKEASDKIQSEIDKLSGNAKDRNSKNIKLFRLQWILFIIAVALLIASRGQEKLKAVFEQLCLLIQLIDVHLIK